MALFEAYLPSFVATLDGEEQPADLEALLGNPKLLERALRHVLRAWYEDQSHDGPPVERWPSFCNRVVAGVDALLQRYGPKRRIALVTSGGPIAAIMRSVSR